MPCSVSSSTFHSFASYFTGTSRRKPNHQQRQRSASHPQLACLSRAHTRASLLASLVLTRLGSCSPAADLNSGLAWLWLGQHRVEHHTLLLAALLALRQSQQHTDSSSSSHAYPTGLAGCCCFSAVLSHVSRAFPLVLAFSSLCFSDRQHWPLLSPLFLRSLHVVYASNSPSHCNHHETDEPAVVRRKLHARAGLFMQQSQTQAGWRGLVVIGCSSRMLLREGDGVNVHGHLGACGQLSLGLGEVCLRARDLGG